MYGLAEEEKEEEEKLIGKSFKENKTMGNASGYARNNQLCGGDKQR